jgi:hypothetical protein
MNTIGTALPIILAGLLATGALTAFVLTFRKLGVLHMNPVEAVGSVVAGERSSAYSAGIVLHCSFGVLFAFIYAALLQLAGPADMTSLAVRAAGIGLLHGFVVGFLLVIFVGEHNPWIDFRQDGMGLAPIYLGAHIVYGLTLGIMFGVFRIFT